MERDYWRIAAGTDGTVVSTTPAVQSDVTLNRGEFVEIPTDQDFVTSATHPDMVAQILASATEIVDPPRGMRCAEDTDCADQYQCQLGGNFQFVCMPPACTEDGAACDLAGHVCRCQSFLSCGCQPVGDPALILFPPTDQYRNDYNFLVPAEFAHNFVTIIAKAGTSVTLDGQPVLPEAFSAVGTTPWIVARVPVAAGATRWCRCPIPSG